MVAKAESIALETAKETANGLKIVLQKIEEITNILTKLSIKSETFENTLKSIQKEVHGGEGRESIATRLRLLEENNREIKDNYKDLKRVIENNKENVEKYREERDKEAKTRNWQLWMTVLGIALSVLNGIIIFVIGIKK